ncbi:MAG TPA: alcohol dehydrogenase catalytic domain-containing protein [Thermoanaerobaculia bacterium]|nr:alcohol dehydrogenase catalytic domain-containing protein [Thermoanaerobaculia bacterium]
MRAVRLSRTGQPLEDVEIDTPAPGRGEVAVAIRATGICHSDVHYCTEEGRARLPLIPGHEIAGVISDIGPDVRDFAPGDRVAIHYLVGEEMIGKELDGGYAESIVVPASNVVAVPSQVPFAHAAVMMCSTATAWHALKIANLRAGESVAIIGFGGLGASAVQLARILGAGRVIAVDVVDAKLRMAEEWGAIAVNAGTGDLTASLRGVDVVLDFATHGPTTVSALRALNPRGRLVFVGINLRSLELDPYSDLLVHERIVTGSADHTRDELVELLNLASEGRLDLDRAITLRVPLAAEAINQVHRDLHHGTRHLRTVIEM